LGHSRLAIALRENLKLVPQGAERDGMISGTGRLTSRAPRCLYTVLDNSALIQPVHLSATIAVELFSFSIKSFSKERRDVAERRVKALGIVEGFNVNRRKTKERKDQKTKETTRQTSLSPGSRGAQPISRNALSGPINFCIDCSRTCVDA
jgi:hypothetical protein